jgi:hypothetical protein
MMSGWQTELKKRCVVIFDSAAAVEKVPLESEFLCLLEYKVIQPGC